MADTPAPIIIKRKKAGHGGHHGGAWKVAYADFVTAMMALFIVLWLLNSSKQIQEAVGGYFKDPSGTSKKVGSSMQGAGDAFQLSKEDMPKLKEQLQKTIQQNEKFEKLKNQIEMTVTSEGLRIELLESEAGTFFDSGSATPSAGGKDLLQALAAQLGDLPNKISLEGHTDSRPFVGKGNYSNWELSADRANAARRIMQESGVRADQVSQVRGYADQRLRKPDAPEDASNRRISLIVQYMLKTDDDAEADKKSSAAASEAEGGPAKEGEKPKEPSAEKPSAAQKSAAPGTDSKAEHSPDKQPK